MSSLAATLSGVVPASETRRIRAPASRGFPGRRVAMVAQAAGDGTQPSTSDDSEDSRWVEAPTPPASAVRDGPDKVRFRSSGAISFHFSKHAKISRVILG